MTKVIAVAIELGGMPIPRGGGARLVDALAQFIRDHGGMLETNRDVERVLVSDGRANGVRITNGETVRATRAVICNVSPTSAFQSLSREVRGGSATAGRKCRSTSRSTARRSGTATSVLHGQLFSI
jgi:phytoene dehydrogenase-like protein